MIAYCEAQSIPEGWSINWASGYTPTYWGVSRIDESPASDFTYTVVNNSIKITKYTGSSAHVIIPTMIDGLPVRTIGTNAFNNCQSIISVVIPTSVTSIEYQAFSSAHALKNVSISNSVTLIEANVFSNCESLVSIVLPEGITEINQYSFFRCTSLTEVIIPDGVTFIGMSTFLGCSSLKSIKYRGTQSQWSAISKGSYWNDEVGSYTITYNYTGN